MDATSIKQLIQQMIKPQIPSLVTGVVIETDPLRITLLNDININLSAISLTIPGRLQPLNKGDQFHMIVYNNGKSYYLLDRM